MSWLIAHPARINGMAVTKIRMRTLIGRRSRDRGAGAISVGFHSPGQHTSRAPSRGRREGVCVGICRFGIGTDKRRLLGRDLGVTSDAMNVGIERRVVGGLRGFAHRDRRGIGFETRLEIVIGAHYLLHGGVAYLL